MRPLSVPDDSSAWFIADTSDLDPDTCGRAPLVGILIALITIAAVLYLAIRLSQMQ